MDYQTIFILALVGFVNIGSKRSCCFVQDQQTHSQIISVCHFDVSFGWHFNTMFLFIFTLLLKSWTQLKYFRIMVKLWPFMHLGVSYDHRFWYIIGDNQHPRNILRIHGFISHTTLHCEKKFNSTFFIQCFCTQVSLLIKSYWWYVSEFVTCFSVFLNKRDIVFL